MRIPYRPVAAGALGLIVLAGSALGQASASHLTVHADGNLVWSTAMPVTPPAGFTITSDKENASIRGTFDVPSSVSIEDCNLVVVGELVGVFASPADESVAVNGSHVNVTMSLSSMLPFTVEDPATHEAPTPERAWVPFSLEVRCGAGSQSLVARSARFWWWWTDNDGSDGTTDDLTTIDKTVVPGVVVQQISTE